MLVKTAKKIALIQGGLGAERDVSLVTGKAFAKALSELGFDFTVIDANELLPQSLMQVKPDVALLAVHGKFAEDGIIQGICEYLKIPYSGSGILSSSLCMDKILSKQIFIQNDIPTPDYQLVDIKTQKIDQIKIELALPIVIKPSREGSSVGVSLVHTQQQVMPALQEAAKYDHMILVEKLIVGKECTVPIFKGRALTSIEIEPKVNFYNYENKYTAGNTEYHLPARLPDEVNKKMQSIALRAFTACRAKVYGRVDFMVDKDGNPFVLEINTLPGCTPTSLFPKSAAKEGINFNEVIKTLIDEASLDYDGLS